MDIEAGCNGEGHVVVQKVLLSTGWVQDESQPGDGRGGEGGGGEGRGGQGRGGEGRGGEGRGKAGLSVHDNLRQSQTIMVAAHFNS